MDCNLDGTPDACDISAATSDDGNGNDIPDECESISGGDFDGDGDVDLTDYAAFADCATGSGSPPSPVNAAAVDLCLAAFDSDGDMDVDLADFAAFCFLFSP